MSEKNTDWGKVFKDIFATLLSNSWIIIPYIALLFFVKTTLLWLLIPLGISFVYKYYEDTQNEKENVSSYNRPGLNRLVFILVEAILMGIGFWCTFKGLKDELGISEVIMMGGFSISVAFLYTVAVIVAMSLFIGIIAAGNTAKHTVFLLIISYLFADFALVLPFNFMYFFRFLKQRYELANTRNHIRNYAGEMSKKYGGKLAKLESDILSNSRTIDSKKDDMTEDSLRQVKALNAALNNGTISKELHDKKSNKITLSNPDLKALRDNREKMNKEKGSVSYAYNRLLKINDNLKAADAQLDVDAATKNIGMAKDSLLEVMQLDSVFRDSTKIFLPLRDAGFENLMSMYDFIGEKVFKEGKAEGLANIDIPADEKKIHTFWYNNEKRIITQSLMLSILIDIFPLILSLIFAYVYQKKVETTDKE